MGKWRRLWKRFSNYVRYDLKEIAFPSSLPNPPGYKPRRKLTREEWLQVLRVASRLYVQSWKRDIGDDIDILKGKGPQRKAENGQNTQNGQKKDRKAREEEFSAFEEIAIAARGGMETLRPAIQRLYMARAEAYKDALKNFIEGYQEGISEMMDAKQSPAKQSQESEKQGKDVNSTKEVKEQSS
eukprot:TRINITY_DN8909_c0_g1_i1.p1 TRINITY_DN8909_c0_g1~~TRINITY_DN8909_c0_g1_i1.p1  ORF type:complete len:184 (+),score=46.36 TRINITY_DN8909_c0_g1_i1:196-747(+)